MLYNKVSYNVICDYSVHAKYNDLYCKSSDITIRYIYQMETFDESVIL